MHHALLCLRALLAAVILLPVVLVFLPVMAFWQLAWGSLLRLWFWYAHRRHGRFILFVSSDSPNWQAHIEQKIIPRLDAHAVVLNWSRRKFWEHECWWEARVFSHWAGHKDFNPLALVFTGGWRVVPLRFYQPFRDLRHGRDQALRQVEAEFFHYLPPEAPVSTSW